MLYSDSMFTSSFSLRSLVFFCLLLFPLAVLSQSSSAFGSVSGTVLDPHGRPIAGATLTLRNNDFTASRNVVTDDDGRFTAAFLTAGPYSVKVAAAGFELKKPVTVTVGAGVNTNLEVRMAVKGEKQVVTVTGTGKTVEGNTVSTKDNRTEATTSNRIAGMTVTYLPRHNRDLSQMAQLAAGAEEDPDAKGLVVAGQRPESTKYAIDGADLNDPMRGGERGAGDGALFFPQVVVREFQVVRSGATADVGGTNAGFVNVATKSGSNKFRGEAFYIGRPPALTSDDAFGHSLDNLQNEIGGAIGGPIKKDRVFFYFGIEQDFLHTPYWTQFAPQTPGGVVPAAVASQQTQIVEKSTPTALFERNDFVVNAKNTLNLQLNYNHAHSTNISDGYTRTLSSADNRSLLDGDSVWARAALTTVFTATTVNHVMADWLTDRRDVEPNSTAPEIFINGFGVLGGTSIGPNRTTVDRFAISDDISTSKHGNQISAGGFFSYAPGRSVNEPYLNSRFDYNSLTDFLVGDIRRYRQTFLGGTAVYDHAISMTGFYVTLKRSLAENLSANIGLRWEGQFNPQPSANMIGPMKIPNDASQWQPRLGLAWNPRSSTVVVRASAGLYDAVTPASALQHLFTDNGMATQVVDSFYDPQVLPLVASGRPLAGVPAGLTVQSGMVFGVNPHFRNPRSFQVGGSIEQEINSKVGFTLGYLRNSTWNLQQFLNTNLLAPVLTRSGLPVFPAARPFPDAGELRTLASSGHSTYDGMTATLNAQVGPRSQLTVNYTLARSRDDGSRFDPLQLASVLDPFRPSLDAAYSDFDVRHNLNLSAVFNLPKGFKANPILFAHSGAPYNPIIGFDTQNDGLDLNDRPVMNGQLAERNSLRQPAFATLDMRFVKDFTLKGKGHHLDLFLDMFNLAGVQNLNFGPSGMSFFGNTASPVFSAGRALYAPAVSRFGGARSVQFTARLVAF